MATTNRASLSDPFAPHTSAELRRVRTADVPDPEMGRRGAMVVGGFVIALVSLVMGSIALAQVWLAPAAADGAAAAPTLQSWETLAMIVLGGLGFAGGAALIGVGMGRWNSPRPPRSDADYTGPGIDAHDPPQPPAVV